MDGRLRDWHTSDLPLEMRLVLNPEAEHLSRRLSTAWAQFARTGNPSQPGLAWPAYSTSRRSVMSWNVPKSEVVDDPHRDERLAVLEIPSGRLL